MTDAVEKNKEGEREFCLVGEGSHLLRSLWRVGELTLCAADEEHCSRDHSSLSKESWLSTQLLGSGHDCGFSSESDGNRRVALLPVSTRIAIVAVPEMIMRVSGSRYQPTCSCRALGRR